MKRSRLLLLFASILLLSGCGKDSDENSSKGNNNSGGTVIDSDVKEWISETMDVYYLWKDKMPDPSSFSNDMTVENYFESLLYRKDKTVARRNDTYGDRFSHIEKLITTKSLKATTTDFGGELISIQYNDAGNVVMQFLFVAPDSQAAAKGLKRGLAFNKVNGTQLTTTNYMSLLSQQSISISNDLDPQLGLGAPLSPITITKETYPGTPIICNKVLNINGTKVGYLVYNKFERGPDDEYASNNNATAPFEEDMRSKFTEFKNMGVQEFILDLRYNPGGYLITAKLLASLIAPENALGKVLAHHQYNSVIENNAKLKNSLGGGTDYFFSKSDVPNNLNLQRLCIITSSHTASASEYVLNCLKPYMQVIQVGETTVGKNQSAVTFKRDKVKDWAITPIISYVSNSNEEGGYEAGIKPISANISHDYNLDDQGYIVGSIALYDFGNENELMLSKALQALGLKSQQPAKSPTRSIDRRISKDNITAPVIKDRGLIQIMN